MTDSEELGSEEDNDNNKDALVDDLTYNSDLFVANQEVNVLE